MMAEKHECSGVNRFSQVNTRCSRNGGEKVGDHWYCWQHNPLAIEARNKKREEESISKWQAVQKREEEKRQLQSLKDQCYEACRNVGDPAEVALGIKELVSLFRNITESAALSYPKGIRVITGSILHSSMIRALANLEAKK